MTNRFFLICFVFFISVTLSAQKILVPQKGLKKITSEELYRTLSVLASDSLEGRAPGTPGDVKAADFIEQEFKKNGLKPYFGNSYRQEIKLYGKKWEDPVLLVNDVQISGSEAIFYLGNRSVDEFEHKELVYIANATDSIINALDLTDKLVLVDLNPLTRSYTIMNKLEAKGVWGVMGFCSLDLSQFHNAVSFNNRMRNLVGLSPRMPVPSERGVRLFVLNNNQLPAIIGFSDTELRDMRFDSSNLLTKKVSIKSPVLIDEVITWNIAGVLKGTNPNLKPMAVTAHYDHVGRQSDGICLGADDNASGVSAIIQVAAAYNAVKKKPVRDVLFVAFGAEELGIIGSEQFMKDYERTDFHANINIDMIGRRDTATKENYVYVMGTAKNPITHQIHQNANIQTVNLKLDYAHGRESSSSGMMSRSDHYHFYRKGIPVVSFFSGLHGDYHTPRDTVDKIDFPLMTRRVQLVFATLYMLVNTEYLGD